MNIHILAGGPTQYLPDLTPYNVPNTCWVGVDKGVINLLDHGIVPEVGFGDFDSVSAAEMQRVEQYVSEVNRFQPEKDETDMELALNWAIAQNPETITIFGATGGRMDHTIGNIHLLLKPLLQSNAVKIQVVDNKNIIYLTKPSTHAISRNPQLKYVSFFPITLEVKGLTLRGFKYPLTNCHIPMGSTLCISNELVEDNGNFSYEEGILMVIRSRD